MIRRANLSDLDTVAEITHTTIRSIYPHYYPAGAVDYFLEHHNPGNIRRDIAQGIVYLFLNDTGNPVGTVTVSGNEINRLFVLPDFQGQGFGRQLLTFAEQEIALRHSVIVLDSSLPAKKMYLKRGYRVTDAHRIETEHGDFLCYDEMEKRISPP